MTDSLRYRALEYAKANNETELGAAAEFLGEPRNKVANTFRKIAKLGMVKRIGKGWFDPRYVYVKGSLNPGPNIPPSRASESTPKADLSRYAKTELELCWPSARVPAQPQK